MGIEENIEVVRREFEEIWNKGNLDVAHEFFADDYKWHLPGIELEGIEAFRNHYITTAKAFPDGQATIDEIFGSGNCVAYRSTFEGTHKGNYLGIPPTGKKIQIKSIVISHFSDGKEAETWESVDSLGLMQQLGVIPTR